MNIVTALQDPTSALKLFKRYSVEANDGVVNSPRAAIAGLQQVKDMATSPENAAIHSSMVHDQDRIAFIELRKSTTVGQKNDAMSDPYRSFLDTGRSERRTRSTR